MVVAAGVDVVELAGLMIVALGILAIEDETFDFVGGVEGVALGVVQVVGVGLEDAADIGGVGRAVLVDDVAEDQDFAVAEVVGRVSRRRRSMQAQVARAGR
jgi:hypothetical protein